ncbi:hypothetical protein [Haladaptatus sp.]|uniref:hypothetical protein n=1 Tax=Haladaptatus sp. TaxID=1973141 RepID=UPI003C38E445
MIRTILGVACASVGALTSAAPGENGPLNGLDGLQGVDDLQGISFDKLNILSLLAQAGYAFQKGNAKRGALLLGAATIAPKSKEASYLVQGVVTLDSIRKRLS